jgi:hypothetical protein
MEASHFVSAKNTFSFPFPYAEQRDKALAPVRKAPQSLCFYSSAPYQYPHGRSSSAETESDGRSGKANKTINYKS